MKRFSVSLGKDSDIEVQGELQLSSGKWILGRSRGADMGCTLLHTLCCL